MMHVPLDTLLALDDAGAGREGRRRAPAHLATCARCRDLLAWVREVRRAARAAAAAPVPAPAGAWDVIRRRYEAGDVVLLPSPAEPAPRPAGRHVPRRRAAWAAGLVLLAAGGAAAAVPRSPVRAWLVRAWSAARAPAPPAPGTTTADGPAAPETLLLVAPEHGAVTIALERPGPDLRLRVREWEGREAEVRAVGAAAGAQFRSGPGRLAIVAPADGEIRLALPAALEHARVEVDGVAYLVKSGGVLRVLAPVASRTGAEIVLPVRR